MTSRHTGRRSSTEPTARCRIRLGGGRGRFAPVAAFVLAIGLQPALALDLFTLWRQPMVPLALPVGGYADYRSVSLVEGRQTEDIVRIQCVGQRGQGPDAVWLVEMIPLQETRDGLVTVAGEGLQVKLSQRILQRQGELPDLVREVVRWQQGQATRLDQEQWAEDPLLAVSLRSEFTPASAELVGTTSRVVAGRELSCDQFVMTAADTLRKQLPSGSMEQISRWEISAALNGQVPFMGIVYASERTTAVSRLDPPSKRFSPPPPLMRVETMELVGFGMGARSALQGD